LSDREAEGRKGVGGAFGRGIFEVARRVGRERRGVLTERDLGSGGERV